MTSRIATATLMTAALATSASAGTIIWSGSDSASDYDVLVGDGSGGVGTVLFDVDYSDFQRFGEPADNFNYKLPPSPRGGGTTTSNSFIVFVYSCSHGYHRRR